MAALRAVFVLLFGAGLAASLAAQNPPPPVPSLPSTGAKPLRKTDLIRLLTSGPMTNKQIALQVRRNCLTFTPSARDLEDIKASTADTAVMSAIATCGRPGSTMRIVAPRTVHAVAGTEITIVARALRWDVPQSGVSLVLQGASGIPGGPAQNSGAGTDSTGVARLRLAVGMEAGTYHLRIALASGTDFPRAPVDLITTAPVVARADVRPAMVVFREGLRSAATVRVDLSDAVGRPAVGIAVELVGTTAELGPIPGATTDAFGRATIAIAESQVRRGGQVGVYAARQLVGSLTVDVQAVVVSDDRTQFIAGTNQRGVVHSAARSPLVLEVRDSGGRPVSHYPVTLAALNGAVSPATTTTTDSVGIVRASVTLGDRAGVVVITANVGRFARQAMMYASPGLPQGLEVWQNGVAVNYVTISGRDSVALHVAAHDLYGNDVQVTGLEAQIGEGGDVVAIRPSSAPAVVVLQPRKTGSATLRLRGSGLESEVAVSALVPPLVTGPWTFDLRAGGVAFNYGFHSLPFIAGRPGFRGEVAAGRAVAPAVRVGAALGFGVLGARDHSASLSVGLSQLLVRGEFLLSQNAQLQPVLEAGTGIYRIKSTDPTNAVYHTSWLYLFGAGANFPLSPRLIGTLRLERQQLVEANSKHVNGAVGALTVLEVGVRLKT